MEVSLQIFSAITLGSVELCFIFHNCHAFDFSILDLLSYFLFLESEHVAFLGMITGWLNDTITKKLVLANVPMIFEAFFKLF